MKRTLITLMASAAAAPAFAEYQTEISMEEVPAEIVDIAATTVPGMNFDRVSTELENGVTVYEFEGYNSAGKHVEVDIDENGEIQEIEMQVSAEQVPPVVERSLEQAAPGFEASYIEFSVRGGGSEFVYEFEGDHEGRTLEIEIAENGDVLFVSDGSLG